MIDLLRNDILAQVTPLSSKKTHGPILFLPWNQITNLEISRGMNMNMYEYVKSQVLEL